MEHMLNVRFAQSVSVGGEQVTYIDTSKGGKYRLQLVDDFRIRITNSKTNRTVYSSLFNAVSWEMDERPKKKGGKKEEQDVFVEYEAEEGAVR